MGSKTQWFTPSSLSTPYNLPPAPGNNHNNNNNNWDPYSMSTSMSMTAMTLEKQNGVLFSSKEWEEGKKLRRAKEEEKEKERDRKKSYLAQKQIARERREGGGVTNEGKFIEREEILTTIN